MACPVCTRSFIAPDVSVVDAIGKRVVVQGRINAIMGVGYRPFGDFLEVTLYPKHGRVKYLKFPTQEVLDGWKLERDQRIRAEGCFHVADGKELILDITMVEHLD